MDWRRPLPLGRMLVLMQREGFRTNVALTGPLGQLFRVARGGYIDPGDAEHCPGNGQQLLVNGNVPQQGNSDIAAGGATGE